MPAGRGAHGGRPAELVEHFFRHETGRLHGTLTRVLGPGRLAMVEDVAQAAMLRALKTWSIGGVPPNPSAWITRVAINLARDMVRHERMSAAKEAAIITHLEQIRSEACRPDEEPGGIGDDALRLMFVCCHPALPADAQVVLALKIVSGFTTGEIARAFLSTEAAIEKQLTRTKQRLREAGIGFEIPPPGELAARLGGVHATLYLLFNEGHKASGGDRLVRGELSQEAMRLMALLVDHPAARTPRSHALFALMLFTAARFPSRIDDDGVLLNLEDQDRSRWDQRLIDRGLEHLARAAQGAELSEYHLQAGIAACHCLAPDVASTNWIRILAHYDGLMRVKPSPVVALNRAVALAQVHGARAGLEAVAAMEGRDRLESHYLLHAVVGELHWRLGEHRAAAASFRRAVQLAHVGAERLHLARMAERSTRAG